MSRISRRFRRFEARFPRVSGDEPIKRAMQQDLQQFSPRERG